MYLFGFCQTDSVLNKTAVFANTQIDTVIKPTSQPKAVSNYPPTPQPKKPELFNSGFIDFQNSGQMNASARVFKIYIGEPT